MTPFYTPDILDYQCLKKKTVTKLEAELFFLLVPAVLIFFLDAGIWAVTMSAFC